jgi:integrase
MYHNEAIVLGRYSKVKNNVTTYYINDFLKEKKLELKIKSYQTYQSKLRLFKQFLDKNRLNDVDISLIDSSVIIAFMKQIQSSKSLSKVTMDKYSQILYSLFDYVRKRRHVKMENPADGIPRLGEIKDEAPDPISDRHRKIFSSEIPKQDPQLWLACLLMYYTALRPGEEIRLLKIRQFNFANKSITIYSTTAKNTERETISMPDQLYEEVTNTYHLDKYPDDYNVFGVGGLPGTTTLGKNNLRNRFNHIRDLLSMPKSYKFYSWKHTGASSLTATGLNSFDLQKHLRHKDMSSTEKYIRKRLGDKNEIIQKKFPDI